MREDQKTKSIHLYPNLFLIVVFALLINVNFAMAEEFEGLNPHAGFDFVLLLDGQSATVSTSATTPTDVHTVGVLSIGKRVLSASLSIIGTEASGMWWISAIGNGRSMFFDFAIGVAPYRGRSVQVMIDETVGIGLVTGGVVLIPPVFAEDPVRYSITVR